MFSIDLVLIARNEARCIERCLAGARDHVDTMIVLDTGSTDDTCARASRAGARVVQSRWHDDFARSRNEALAHSHADWRLVLDADEWIIGGLEAVASLRSRSPDHLGVVTVENLFDASHGDRACSPSWIPRILPNGVGYVGRIHEQPDSVLPRRRTDLRVRHDGYLREVMRAKGARNRVLLERALIEHPDDVYLRYQYGKDLELAGDHAAAVAHFERALAGADASAVWRHDLVLRLMFSLKRCGRHAQALALAETEATRWEDSPDFHFAIGDLLLDWAAVDPARGPTLVAQIDARWRRALAIGERPDLPDSVQGRGSFLAAHNLAVLHGLLGRTAEAQQWQSRANAMRGDRSTPPVA